MSKVICIAGESGSGKTTAMRTLDPKETYYIDCDGKGLSWRGWRTQYNKENKNYKATSDVLTIKKLLQGINDKCPHIHVVVIDTINGIMVDDEMRRRKEKNFDKWMDLAACIWELVSGFYDFRDDLVIVMTAHTETIRTEDGYQFTHIKTNGQKLNKLVLESKFTSVLIAKAKEDGSFVFETQARNSTAKTPLDAFDSFEIPNDISAVIKALEDY